MKSKTWENCASAYLQHLKAAGRAKGTIRIHRYYLQVMRGSPHTPGWYPGKGLRHGLLSMIGNRKQDEAPKV